MRVKERHHVFRRGDVVGLVTQKRNRFAAGPLVTAAGDGAQLNGSSLRTIRIRAAGGLSLLMRDHRLRATSITLRPRRRHLFGAVRSINAHVVAVSYTHL